MKEWDKKRREEIQRMFGDLQVTRKKAVLDKRLEEKIYQQQNYLKNKKPKIY